MCCEITRTNNITMSEKNCNKRSEKSAESNGGRLLMLTETNEFTYLKNRSKKIFFFQKRKQFNVQVHADFFYFFPFHSPLFWSVRLAGFSLFSSGCFFNGCEKSCRLCFGHIHSQQREKGILPSSHIDRKLCCLAIKSKVLHSEWEYLEKNCSRNHLFFGVPANN